MSTPVWKSVPLGGPSLIEASAGTGKTYTLERLYLRALLDVEGAGVENVLAVTFTVAAAAELRERIRRLIRTCLLEKKRPEDEAPLDEAGIHKLKAALGSFEHAVIQTIHSFCQRTLSEYSLWTGMPLRLDISENRASELAARALRDWLRLNPEKWTGAELDELAALLGDKDGSLESLEEEVLDMEKIRRTYHRLEADQNPETFKRFEKLLAGVCEKIQTEKWRLGSFAHEDMLTLLARCIETRPDFAARLRARYKAALIDEFQDTDPVQWSIFRNLFLANAGSGSHPTLVLVGDPKQSIYRFRDGDVETYKDARKEISSAKGGRFNLDTNFRSSAGLLFSTDHLLSAGLQADSLGIETWKASQFPKTPGSKPGQIFLPSKKNPEPGLALVNIGCGKSTELRDTWFSWIADECVRLLSSRAILKPLVPSESGKALVAGDIAILVSSHTEARELEKTLLEKNIPVSRQKPEGEHVFETAEGSFVLRWLEALVDASDRKLRRSLAEPLWDIPLGFFFKHASGPVSDEPHPLLPLEKWQDAFSIWRRLLASGQIIALFERLLHDPLPMPAGASLAEIISRKEEHTRDRTLTNLRHLEEILHRLQHGSHRAGQGLVLDFKKIAADPDTAKQEGQLRLDSDKEAIQILTIHHAKGLEWPVVFVAGLLSQYRGGTDAVFKVRKNLSLTEVYHKAFLSEEKNEALKEVEKNQTFQENERAIYVAWTRAQTKLYAPLLSPIDKNKSSMSLYYERLFGEEFWKEKMNAPSQENLAKLFGEWVAAHPFPSDASWELLNATEKSANKLEQSDNTLHLEPAVIPSALNESHLKKEKRSRTSFSGLTQGDSLRLSLDEKPSDEDETPVVETIFSVVKGTLSSEEAPAGNETGNVIHRLLEIFPHQKLDTANASELLANVEFKTSLDAAVKEHLPSSAGNDAHKLGLAELVRRAAISRLPLEKDGLPFFRLADIGDEKLAEADFLAGLSLREKITPENFPGFKHLPPIESISGWLNGTMDLVLRAPDGKIHIVDYKSNLIKGATGETLEAALERIMEESFYNLQAMIYAAALWRFLDERGATGLFGGVHYQFLRAISPDPEIRSGVVSRFPEPKELANAAKRLFGEKF